MIGKVFWRSAIVAAATIGAIAPAHALDFVFTTSSSSALYGTASNSITLPSVGGVTVTATAWSAPLLSSTPNAAYLGRYDKGLGVTNSAEGTGTGNKHTIDNLDGYDFVRLVFSQAVNLTGLIKTNFDINGQTDGDYWFSYGTVAGDATSFANWSSIVARGADRDSNAATSTTQFSNVWYIGAARTAEKNDGFKLGTVKANVQQAVPEPATWLMMILGFGAIGTVVRKRARVMAKVRSMLAATLGRRLLTGPAA